MHWILEVIPWWVWAILALPIVALLATRGGRLWALYIVGFLVAIFGYQRAYKRGYDARKDDGQKETDRAIRDAADARSTADTDRMHDDGFRRD